MSTGTPARCPLPEHHAHDTEHGAQPAVFPFELRFASHGVDAIAGTTMTESVVTSTRTLSPTLTVPLSTMFTAEWAAPLRAAIAGVSTDDWQYRAGPGGQFCFEAAELARKARDNAVQAINALAQGLEDEGVHMLPEGEEYDHLVTPLWESYKLYTVIMHEAIARTTEPGMLVTATRCAEVLIDGFEDLRITTAGGRELGWPYDDGRYGEEFFGPTVPMGATRLAVKGYMTQMLFYDGWGYRAEEMWYALGNVSGAHDSVARALERCVVAFESLHILTPAESDFECLDTVEMHVLAESFYKHDEGPPPSIDATIKQVLSARDVMSLHPSVTAMFADLRDFRKSCRLKEGMTRWAWPNRVDVDIHTFKLAREYCSRHKRLHYHQLFQRWFHIFRIVSYWTLATGSSQGAITGPIGKRARLEYAADMGTGAASVA